MWAGRVDPISGRIEDIAKFDPGPRAFVHRDFAQDAFARQRSSDEVRLALMAGDGLASVGDIGRGQFDHPAIVAQRERESGR